MIKTMLKKRSKICEGDPYPLAEWEGGGRGVQIRGGPNPL